jgi:hypothetical protein
MLLSIMKTSLINSVVDTFQGKECDSNIIPSLLPDLDLISQPQHDPQSQLQCIACNYYGS